MNISPHRLCLYGSLFLGLITGAESRAQTYSLLQLRGLASPSGTVYASTPSGINNAGQIVGSSTTGGTTYATLWNGTTPGDLGSLFGHGGAATAINDAGQVVGYSVTVAGSTEPTLWSGGTTTDLGSNGTSSGVAWAINSSGQAAGSIVAEGALWSGGAITTFGPLVAGANNGTEAFAINSAGQIVGASGYFVCVTGACPQPCHAFLWTAGTMTDLGALRNDGSSVAAAINSAGQVVGMSLNQVDSCRSLAFVRTSVSRAFSWSGGTLSQLNALGSSAANGNAFNDVGSARAINAAGQIVGWSNTAHGEQRATLWVNGTPVDLNSLIDAGSPLKSSVTLMQAVAINDNGWILADSYLLVPIIFSPAALSFSAQALGTISAPQQVAITNQGTAPLVITAISASPNYSQQNNCPAALSIGAKCTVSVTFSPVMPSSAAAFLTLTSGAADLSLPLTGTATVSATLAASATTVTVGKPVTLTWTSSSGTTCAPGGGTTGDGWTGSLKSSGSLAVTESIDGSFTYTILCTAGTASQQAQVIVLVTAAPPPSSGGGGGALDLVSLTALLSLFALRFRARRAFHQPLFGEPGEDANHPDTRLAVTVLRKL